MTGLFSGESIIEVSQTATPFSVLSMPTLCVTGHRDAFINKVSEREWAHLIWREHVGNDTRLMNSLHPEQAFQSTVKCYEAYRHTALS